jgi:hypothetical protein
VVVPCVDDAFWSETTVSWILHERCVLDSLLTCFCSVIQAGDQRADPVIVSDNSLGAVSSGDVAFLMLKANSVSALSLSTGRVG